MVSEQDYKRVRWASRRGMLELDLVLVPFVENRFPELSEEDQRRYIKLLEGEDNELFAWCMGRGKPEAPELAAIIEQIIAYARTEKS